MTGQLLRRALLLMIVVFFSHTSLMASDKGNTAPDIFGRNLSGGLFKLSKTNGKPRVLNFFSTNCKPCIREMPELARMEKQFSNVQFISIHLEDRDKETVRKFISKLSSAPGTIVCAGPLVKKEYRLPGYPYTVIIDPDGRIKRRIPGYSKENMALIREILSAY